MIDRMRMAHLSGIDLNLLVYLDLLLRESSVTKAAARAGITQSAMSRALNRLRDQLDDKVLVQVGRSMQPTEHARSLRAPLNDVLAQIRHKIFAPRTFDPATAARAFSIAAPDFIDVLITKRLVTRLAEQAPNIDIHVAGMGPAVRGDILDGRLDLLIGLPPGDRASLHARRILSDRFVCVMRRGHPASRRKKMTLSDYLRFPHALVTPGGRPGSIVDSALGKRNAKRRVAVRVHSFLLAPSYVVDTDYLLTIPQKVARELCDDSDVITRELPIALPELHLSSVWHARNHRDHAHSWFRSQIADIAKDL